jgi:hypothetical protein
LGELRVDVLAGNEPAGPVPVTAVGSHDTASAVVKYRHQGSSAGSQPSSPYQ